jgi:hypothetical protein
VPLAPVSSARLDGLLEPIDGQQRLRRDHGLRCMHGHARLRLVRRLRAMHGRHGVGREQRNVLRAVVGLGGLELLSARGRERPVARSASVTSPSIVRTFANIVFRKSLPVAHRVSPRGAYQP